MIIISFTPAGRGLYARRTLLHVAGMSDEMTK